MAEVAGMMQDCARPSAARAMSSAGNLWGCGRRLIRLVAPVTAVHRQQAALHDWDAAYPVCQDPQRYLLGKLVIGAHARSL